MSLNIDPKLALYEEDETFVNPILLYLTRPNIYVYQNNVINKSRFVEKKFLAVKKVPQVHLDGIHQK